MVGRIGVHVAAQFFVELRIGHGPDHAVGHDLGPEAEPFVEPLPHGPQPGRAEKQRRAVVWIAHPQLAQ